MRAMRRPRKIITPYHATSAHRPSSLSATFLTQSQLSCLKVTVKAVIRGGLSDFFASRFL